MYFVFVHSKAMNKSELPLSEIYEKTGTELFPYGIMAMGLNLEHIFYGC
jgi:hypothetical protein